MSSRLNRAPTMSFTLTPDDVGGGDEGYLRDVEGGLRFFFSSTEDNNGNMLELSVTALEEVTISHNVGGVAGNQFAVKDPAITETNEFVPADELTLTIDAFDAPMTWNGTDFYDGTADAGLHAFLLALPDDAEVTAVVVKIAPTPPPP